MFSRILFATAMVAFIVGASALPIHMSPRALVEMQSGPGNKCILAGGACGDINVVKCAGSFLQGKCPGAAHIQCCIPPAGGYTAPTPPPPTPAAASLCAASGGMCMSSLGNSCSTGFKSGLCPGAADVKCCLSGLDFKKLAKCYPQGEAEEVKTKIGGAVNADWIKNTCAIRMSHTLNCAGKFIPQMGGESIRGKQPQNWNYIFRVKQLSPMVKKMFGLGITIKAPTGRGVPVERLAGKKGIIYFDTTGLWDDATGHFDLWDGKAMVEKSHATEETTTRYFDGSVSVTFWEFQ